MRKQDRRIVTELDLVSLNSMKPKNNLVLLKSISDNRRGKLLGKEIRLDTTFKPEHYANVIYNVKAMPKRLIYDARRDDWGNYIIQPGMEWKTRIDMREGDIVWANYNQAINSLKIRCEDDIYQLMHYSHIYLSIRKWIPEDDGYVMFIDFEKVSKVIGVDEALNEHIHTNILAVDPGYMPDVRLADYKKKGADVQLVRSTPVDKLPENVMMRRDKHDGYDEISFWKVIMHNGYLLFEGVSQKVDSPLILPPENQNRFGIIKYMGRPNEEYREHYTWDDDQLRIGDCIHLAYKFSKKLENNPLIARFGDGHKLHITQRHRILGITKLDQ